MRLPKEDKAGLYITVIFHLVVIIVLLCTQIGAALKKENSFVLDFTKQERVEKLRKEASLKEEISRRLDELIASQTGTPVRNVAVDRSALKDDRGTDADKLYEDAERLERELKGGFTPEENDDDYVAQPRKEKSPEKHDQAYSGPSVVSYSLEGRKASHLPIPAYRCMGAGRVTVIITVDPSGRVVQAKVQESVSSPDACLRNFAIRAARLSRFSSSPSAPPKQLGDIVYEFIAQ